MSRTTKSTLSLARMAYDGAKQALPLYSHRFSPKKFTQPQVMAILVLKEAKRGDYRGITQELREWRELREALELEGKPVPHYSTLCKAASRLPRKKTCADLLNATLEQARSLGLLHDPGADKSDERSALASIDSTGLETRHVSDHYRRRTGRKSRRFPKLAEVIDVKSHLALACWCGRGPSPDQPHLRSTIREAHQRHRFRAIAADAGYDGEHHHRYLVERLNVIGIINPGMGRPAKDPKHVPGGFYRGFLHKHWPKNLYGQRSQSECRISMLKRRLGSALTARKRVTQDQQMRLRDIALNFMINAEPENQG